MFWGPTDPARTSAWNDVPGLDGATNGYVVEYEPGSRGLGCARQVVVRNGVTAKVAAARARVRAARTRGVRRAAQRQVDRLLARRAAAVKRTTTICKG